VFQKTSKPVTDIHVNPALFKPFAQLGVLQLTFAGPDRAMTVRVPNNPDFIGLIMPYQGPVLADPAMLPDWIP
jgi:hypothetical protein